jgi:hypothetical protein
MLHGGISRIVVFRLGGEEVWTVRRFGDYASSAAASSELNDVGCEEESGD